VLWFRSLHPTPVVIKPEGPTLATPMLATLGVGLGSLLLLFLGVFLMRYTVEVARHTVDVREHQARA